MREKRPGVWELRAFLGRDDDNRPRQVSRTVHGGKRAATKALAALEADANAGKLGRAETGTSTVSALTRRYLAHLVRLGRSPKTLYTYEGYIRTVIDPEVGGNRVRSLTALHLDDLYTRIQKAGRSAAVIRKVHVLLSGALGQAV